jgi:ribosomal protein L37AE/L43A
MNDENTKYLIEKYPTLYKQYYLPMQETAMCWGFECGDGWFNLIDELSSKIIELDKNVEAIQVKEKFGGLRFYITSSTNDVHELISLYEHKSFTICEECGQPGMLRTDKGWWRTLCDKCNNHSER